MQADVGTDDSSNPWERGAVQLLAGWQAGPCDIVVGGL